MKKIIFAAMAVLAFGFTNAQEGGFKLGVHGGFITGDSSDFYSANFGVDAAYTWAVSDKFSAGVLTGYSSYPAKSDPFGLSDEFEDIGFEVEVEAENAAFIPVAATGQFSISDSWFLGADLGYAIYVGNGESDGGFLYQPKFGFQTEKIELYAGYKGISIDGGTLASINLGFNYKF